MAFAADRSSSGVRPAAGHAGVAPLRLRQRGACSGPVPRPGPTGPLLPGPPRCDRCSHSSRAFSRDSHPFPVALGAVACDRTILLLVLVAAFSSFTIPPVSDSFLSHLLAFCLGHLCVRLGKIFISHLHPPIEFSPTILHILTFSLNATLFAHSHILSLIPRYLPSFPPCTETRPTPQLERAFEMADGNGPVAMARAFPMLMMAAAPHRLAKQQRVGGGGAVAVGAGAHTVAPHALPAPFPAGAQHPRAPFAAVGSLVD